MGFLIAWYIQQSKQIFMLSIFTLTLLTKTSTDKQITRADFLLGSGMFLIILRRMSLGLQTQ